MDLQICRGMLMVQGYVRQALILKSSLQSSNQLKLAKSKTKKLVKNKRKTFKLYLLLQLMLKNKIKLAVKLKAKLLDPLTMLFGI